MNNALNKKLCKDTVEIDNPGLSLDDFCVMVKAAGRENPCCLGSL